MSGYGALYQLLAARLGFDVHSIGTDAVARVIREGMDAAGVASPQRYAQLLATDDDLWATLVDRVVVPETWFFRDSAPFELAAELVADRVQRSLRPVRLLSCPCSTGEEPFSLAMALHDRGVPEGSCVIDAVDVSRQAIAHARRGVYRPWAFRGEETTYRGRHFDPMEQPGAWRIHGGIRAMVQFRQANLLGDDLLADAMPYDLVFCRNLLIYLVPEARARLLDVVIPRLLATDGVVFLGHTEAQIAREHGFASLGSARASAVTRRSATSPSIAAAIPVVTTAHVPREMVAPPPVTGTPPPDPPVPRPADAEDDELLARTRQLADRGKIEDALHACRAYLRRVADSVDAHFLMGVLHDALGHVDEAERWYRKALYLDPTHGEALVHLTLNRERRGRATGAALLRTRERKAGSSGTGR